jgi:hypothetical protein
VGLTVELRRSPIAFNRIGRRLKPTSDLDGDFSKATRSVAAAAAALKADVRSRWKFSKATRSVAAGLFGGEAITQAIRDLPTRWAKIIDRSVNEIGCG